jgi:hypothetical protein
MRSGKCFAGLGVAMVMMSGLQGCSTLKATPVATDILWRGGRPAPTDVGDLLGKGVHIQTVVNLELWHEDRAAFAAARISGPETGNLTYFRVKDWEPLVVLARSVLDRHVAHFLAIVQSQPRPIYVHCQAGKNRTGVMVAAYRVLEENWSAECAIADMAEYKGFWFAADSAYIRSLSDERHRAKIREATKAWAARLKPDARIVCGEGRCKVGAG